MTTQPDKQQPVYVVKQSSPEAEGAATTALWLEIIFGLFSLLGVGHVYSGRVVLGLILMVGWWIYMAVATFLSTITLGVAACVFVPVYIAVPIISGIQARTYMQKSSGNGSWKSVGLVAGGGCLLVVIISTVLVLSSGLLVALSNQ